MASLQLIPSTSFHGTSLLFSRSRGHQLYIPSDFRFTCSSLRSHSKRHGSPPSASISKRHISSLLTSSLHMHTPQGEALLAMTNEHLPPVLISQVASQQLELLAAAAAESARSSSVLQRRIADIQANDITKALQDITLALVTHRLLYATLAVPDHTPRQRHDALAQEALDDRLQAIHPPFLHPLIDRHVALVVNGNDRPHLPVDPHVLARVCTFEMGKMYAASIMHGYFLARVYQRFKLERVLQLELEAVIPMEGFGANGPQELESGVYVSMEDYLQSQAFNDKEAFHHLNIVNSPHSLNVIERHCQALFGIPLHTSSILNIRLGSVRSLILQALAFGALLWDLENKFISSFYP